MTELTGATLATVAAFAAATSITPGPNNMMLLASGVNFGLARTGPHWMGVCLGLLIILLLGAMDVQQWLFQWAWIQTAVKWLGSAYLLYLAWRQFHTSAQLREASQDAKRPMTFLDAALFQWVKPKVWAMVMGYFSTYVPSRAGFGDTVGLCLLFAAVNAPCVGIWAVAGHRLQHWLQRGARIRRFNQAMGLLLAASVVLAWTWA